MNANMKLGIGAILAAIGALGIVIGPTLGFTDLGRPWSFLLGFVVGIIAGMGSVLSISGLIDVRRNRWPAATASCFQQIHLLRRSGQQVRRSRTHRRIAEMSMRDQKAQSLQEEQAIYNEFIRTHPKSRLEHKGQSLEYIACGHGSHIMLIPPHISSLFPSEMGYRHILGFESQFRIIAPSLIESDNLDDIAASLLHVIEKERAGPLILFGQSGSGITAQVFFRRYPQYVAGMILVNTVAPGHPASRLPLFTLFKLLPAALLKVIFKREFMKLLDLASLPPGLAPRLEVSRVLLNECFEARFSKRRLATDMQNALKFNAEGFASPELLADWSGRVLIVTSEDDAGFEDSKLLSEKLPNASLLVLEKGYGHMAPAVKSQEVHSAIEHLMNSLGQWPSEIG